MVLTHISIRQPTDQELRALERLAHSRTIEACLVGRARIVLAIARGQRPSQVAHELGVSRPTVYAWIHRFNDQGIDGLRERPRTGRRPIYTAEQHAEVVAAALTDPRRLDLPFGCWTPDRLRAYLNE
jgi:transposase